MPITKDPLNGMTVEDFNRLSEGIFHNFMNKIRKDLKKKTKVKFPPKKGAERYCPGCDNYLYDDKRLCRECGELNA